MNTFKKTLLTVTLLDMKITNESKNPKPTECPEIVCQAQIGGGLN